jgi:hypothetical protein
VGKRVFRFKKPYNNRVASTIKLNTIPAIAKTTVMFSVGRLKLKLLLCSIPTFVMANQMEFVQIVTKNFTSWIINIPGWDEEIGFEGISLLKKVNEQRERPV